MNDTQFDWISEISKVSNSLSVKPMYTIVDYEQPMVFFQIDAIKLVLKYHKGFWYYRILFGKSQQFYHLMIPYTLAVVTLDEFLNNLSNQLKG